ncbi:MAG TPA: ABC transporter substrate-binding protein [Afifellaceae bacterium]|nr:ABC transporter substrate-binding protein [Afifellaceae bacterium]
MRAAQAALVFAGLAAAAPAAETLSVLQQRGAEIYHKGEGGSERPVLATIGGADVRLPGTALPCAGCHGADGFGRPEGGIAPVPLTWDHLTKPYGHRHSSGRDHPAFSEATLRRAIAHGIDPAGNRLDPAMPRFDMADEDFAALTAFLKTLGTKQARGVTAATITLGILVAGEGRLGEAGDAAAAMVRAYLKEINAQAGIYGRAVTLRSERPVNDPAAALAALDRLIDEPVFALVVAVPPGLQAAVAERAEAAAVPTFHFWPPVAAVRPDRQRYGFYLLGGLKQEVETLVRFAEESVTPDRRRAALVVAPDRDDPVVEAVTSRWPEAVRVPPPASVEEARRFARRLRAEGADVLFILARDDGVARLLAAAAEEGWPPTVLAPGSLAGEALRSPAPSFEGKVFIAFPLGQTDLNQEHVARLAALRADAGARHAFAEAAAYATVSLLLEALRLAGRELSRDALIASVETLHRFRTGVVPPLSFGPNRRIGAAEPRIVRSR